MQALEDSR
ncbi:RNA polymerase ECF-subfamily sigma-70 factor [Pseudomonas aeruginosa]|nr:RNA polymerase ECF-subfamily sigma-70 factor [Pseudomonas aeruginosa]